MQPEAACNNLSMISGVINVYKGKGYTSFHVVAVLRHFTGEKKIGHTGTLDPDACGVLPVCIGRATKLVDKLTDTDKQYRAVMKLGIKTDTQDVTGTVLEEMDREVIRKTISSDKILSAFDAFTGEISQIPPMYSAVKVGGVKLVNEARKGRIIDREARKVTVYGFKDIVIDTDLLEISFTIDCSKGTYVRTICEDIGDMIGIPSCLKSLERTKASGLGIEDTVTLDQIEKFSENGTLEDHIISTDRFLLEYDYIVVKDNAVRRLVFGNIMLRDDIETYPFKTKCPGNMGQPLKSGTYRIYDNNGEFYALYRFDEDAVVYKCDKMFR